MSLKQELYNQCCRFVENKLGNIQKAILEIQESLTTETKSSAGDKHETGRAMLQLEREKAGNQLAEINKYEETLSKIDVSKTNKIIGLGSIVFTTEANYFIAIGAGEIKANDQKFYAVSSNAPIGQLLIGKKVGDDIVFRNKKFKILNLL